MRASISAGKFGVTATTQPENALERVLADSVLSLRACDHYRWPLLTSTSLTKRPQQPWFGQPREKNLNSFKNVPLLFLVLEVDWLRNFEVSQLRPQPQAEVTVIFSNRHSLIGCFTTVSTRSVWAPRGSINSNLKKLLLLPFGCCWFLFFLHLL